VEIIHIDVYGPLCVAVSGGLIFLHKIPPMIWVGICVYLFKEKGVWYFELVQSIVGMKRKIIVTRKSSIYDWIIKNKIWVTSLAMHLRSCRIVPQLMLPENAIGVWSIRETELNLIGYGKINKMPLYFCSLYISDYRFYTEKSAIMIRWNRHHMSYGLGSDLNVFS
jgi:hypothetical protein